MESEITLVVHIRRELHKKLKVYCANQGITIQSIVEELIEKRLKGV